MVRVEQQRRLAGRLQDLAVRVRVRAVDLEQLHVVEAALLEQRGGRLRALAHVGRVEAGEGDRGNANQRLQIFDVRREVSR